MVDRFGGIDDAIKSAAAKANLTNYHVREYPEPESLMKQVFGKSGGPLDKSQLLRQEIGEENFKLYQQMKRIKELTNTAQARLPFEFYFK